MFRTVSYILAGGIILSAIAAVIHITDTGARTQAEFIQISVLAQSQANYGVDEHAMTIPAVSMEIIEDAVHDAQADSPIRVITYISLPFLEEQPESQEKEESDPVEELKELNELEDEIIGNDNKDKDKDKNKNKDKDNNGKGPKEDKDNNGNEKNKGRDNNGNQK